MNVSNQSQAGVCFYDPLRQRGILFLVFFFFYLQLLTVMKFPFCAAETKIKSIMKTKQNIALQTLTHFHIEV